MTPTNESLAPCPFCSEPIRSLATKCRHCKEYLWEGWSERSEPLRSKSPPSDVADPRRPPPREPPPPVPPKLAASGTSEQPDGGNPKRRGTYVIRFLEAMAALALALAFVAALAERPLYRLVGVGCFVGALTSFRGALGRQPLRWAPVARRSALGGLTSSTVLWSLGAHGNAIAESAGFAIGAAACVSASVCFGFYAWQGSTAVGNG